MAKGFKYRGRERTVEEVVRRSKQAGSNFDSYLLSEVQLFKPKEGENTVRIMPPTWEDVEKYGTGWELGVYVHYGIGPDEGAYLCLDKMKGEDCPVCAARRDAADEEEEKAFRPSYRPLCWVIDRDNEKAGPMIWSMPVTMFKDINARSVDKKGGTPILIDDPEEGFDLVFNREGSGLKTKYTGIEVVREASPLHDNEKQQNRWLDYITEHPLPDVLNFYDADHIEKVLFGRVDRRSKDEEPAEEVAPRSRRRPAVEEEEPTPRRRLAVEEEEEAAPRRTARRSVEPEEPAEEEEPAPRSRRRALLDEEPAEETPRRRRAAEEEEEPPPRRRPVRRAAEEDDEIPFDDRERRRGRGAAEGSEPEAAEEEPSPVSRAKAVLSRLKPSGRRS